MLQSMLRQWEVRQQAVVDILSELAIIISELVDILRAFEYLLQERLTLQEFFRQTNVGHLQQTG